MPMKPPPAPEQICPQSRVSTSTSRLPSCPSRSEIQTRDLFLLPRSCPATAVRCHCECAASIDTEHSTDRSRTAQHHTSSLRLLLLLLHLCDALFVEADGEVHLEDALHDEELRQPVAEPAQRQRGSPGPCCGYGVCGQPKTVAARGLAGVQEGRCRGVTSASD